MSKKCPCCGFYTLNEEDSLYDICPVCFWENDPSQEKYIGELGANNVSLTEGRDNYRRFGACEIRFLANTRAPRLEEFGEQDG